MTTSPVSLLALASVLLAACTDSPSMPIAPEPPHGDPDSGVLVECRADIRAGSMSCAPVAPHAGGASADLILGGQGTYVLLDNDSIVVAGGVFSTRVTLQNLTAQAMGTLDGSTASARGVRVFFHQGPTNGVEVSNEDGVAMYTAPAQPYFQYDGILHPQQVSAGRTWSFSLNGETGSFSFQVYVVAQVPSETGLLRFEQLKGRLTGQQLTDVWTDGRIVVAVGFGGFLRSGDGGKSWKRVRANPEELSALWGESSTIVAVGRYGRILRSRDGGVTWSSVSSGTAEWLTDVWGAGSIVVAVGFNGTILRSTDAGATWTSVSSGTTMLLHGVWGQGSTFVVVSWHGGIFRSTDAGAEWSEVGTAYSHVGLRAVGGAGSLVVAAGSGLFLRSADGGATWKVVPGTFYDVYSVWGEDSTFIATGRTGRRSVNGGVSWEDISEPAIHGWGVSGHGSTAVAVGEAGTIVRSTDRGRTWADIDKGHLSFFYDVWGTGDTLIVTGDYGTMLRSTDRGDSWTTLRVGLNHHAAIWGQGSTVVAVGGEIVRSTDAGASWTRIAEATTEYLRDVWGDGSTVIVVGDFGSIRRSTNGGTDFTSVASGTTEALYGVWGKGSTFFAVGIRGMLRSTDGGATWSRVITYPTGALYSVWGEGSTVVAVGNEGNTARILRSTDGGNSWVAVKYPAYQFPRTVSGSGSTLLACSWLGTLVRSTDGGATWHVLDAAGTDANFFGIWVADAHLAIVVGDFGRVFRGTR